METRRLGRTGYSVSVLGVGGHTYPVGDGPDAFCTPDDRARLIGRLLEAGVTYFDTTWQNEVDLLADSFRRLGLNRPVLVSLQFVDGVSDPAWREKLRRELETRLATMGYDHAPLFLMGVGNHHPPYAEIAAACEALYALKQEGLIRNIGLSCHDLDAFDSIAQVIEETDLPDYLMIRYNWKFPQAAERLFPIAQRHNVGIVNMKVLCWDCGPEQWDRRISMFEPIDASDRAPRTSRLNAAQQALRWCLETAPCATTVPSINAPWEAEQLLQAVEFSEAPVDASEFPRWVDRLDDLDALERMANSAESRAIRDRARALRDKLAASA